MTCWCGNDRLDPFCDGYGHCTACQTLVSTAANRADAGAVHDDAADFYGRDYWFMHQTADLQLPDIATRARTDMADRCVHWLRQLLRFVSPPAKVLEIGCGHGGFVSLMRQAGFDATGLELSPAIVDFAKRTFDVPVLTGPIEAQSIEPNSLDAIVMMDVLEHLPEPVATMRRCVEMLKPTGVMLVQTPAYPASTTLAQLHSRQHKFPEMLDPREHLFLFSEASAEHLLRSAGAKDVRFVPAVFDFYDMCFVAARRTLIEIGATPTSNPRSSDVGHRRPATVAAAKNIGTCATLRSPHDTAFSAAPERTPVLPGLRQTRAVPTTRPAASAKFAWTMPTLSYRTAGESHGKALIAPGRRNARGRAGGRGLNQRRASPTSGRVRPRRPPENRNRSHRVAHRRANGSHHRVADHDADPEQR